MPPLEILLPLRNPTGVLKATIDSLVSQTERTFSVLVSDNFSASGQEHIAAAMTTLTAAGIPARRIAPPQELERVEHWNWLHFESSAAWLKPLFAGDWLEPDYIATIRQECVAEPRCRYVYAGYRLHLPGASREQDVIGNWAGRFCPPAEMQDVVTRLGHQFGPPSGAAYEREAFIALGGYHTGLPICADSLFFCALAARFGALGVRRVLFHFQIHGDRFSTTLPGRRKATTVEQITCAATLAYHAWTEARSVPVPKLARHFARIWRDHLFRR